MYSVISNVSTVGLFLPTGSAVLSTCFLHITALRMNKMLSNDCIGTQEFHTFYKTTDTLEGSQFQDTAFDQTAAGSTLIAHQNGKVLKSACFPFCFT